MANTTDEISASGPAPTAEEPPRKSGAFQISQEPVTAGESEIEAHKFEVAPEPVSGPKPATPEFEDLGQLPATYQEDTLFLVARDPRWLFAYWDFDWTRYPASAMRYGYAQFFLKVTRLGGEQESLVEIQPAARNWYVPVSHPNTDYAAEIGYFDQGSAWRAVVRSGPAHTPADALAPETSALDFATVPAHLTFERLLELVQERMAEGESLLAALARVAGEGRIEFRAGQAPTWTEEQKRVLAALLGNRLTDLVGLGSEEIDQLLRKSLHEKLSSEAASGLSLSAGLGAGGASLFSALGASLFSAIGASWSAQPFSVKTERGFFMHVNAEIIFYGGTHPDATVTVNGERIHLTPDGRFRYHFTLPDGDHEIPIVAISPDQVEQRSATLSFRRGTERAGEVGATGQPVELSPLIGRK
jgi:uncharacterized protein